MSEQTFKSPNSYESESDVSTPSPIAPVGVPAGIIGTANRGPAFVPVTVGNFDQFVQYFGDFDSKKYGVIAANEFLKHRNSLTFLRVLGSGGNVTSADIERARLTGRDVGAGVSFERDDDGTGGVVFLAAAHALKPNEALGMPIFTDNATFETSANLIRGMVMLASGSTMTVQHMTASGTGGYAGLMDGKFKVAITSPRGGEFAYTDGTAGLKVLTASMDPSAPDYFGKILNSNPNKFVEEQHYLHADFAVDAELAEATDVGVLYGSGNTTTSGGDSTTTFDQLYGAFDTRFKAPKTTWFISQPYGNTEYDLFHFEALDDGEYANTLYKISITNIQASVAEANPYGSFAVQVRAYNDSDTSPIVLEQFPNCTLNPDDQNYVGRIIGDRKVTFNFDATNESDRRVVSFGKYSNKSQYVRIKMSDQVERGLVPATALPFGFRGLPVLKTNDTLTDGAADTPRLAGDGVGDLVNSVLPPIPLRFKVTRGEVNPAGGFAGNPGIAEQTSNQYYWGVKFERNTTPLSANSAIEKNSLLTAYSKFLGSHQLDTILTGSGADEFNNNKFSLARVALSNQLSGSTSLSNIITGSAAQHMREAAYIRDGEMDGSTYSVDDGVLPQRITLATVLTKMSAPDFNRFSQYTKFTNMFYGGYDGVNFLDNDAKMMNDRAVSFDQSGGADPEGTSPGFGVSFAGAGQLNSTVRAYTTAIDIMTDIQNVNINILATPGIREPFLTDYALTKVRDYGLAYYVVDIPSYSDTGERIYDGDNGKPDVDATEVAFSGRAIDNNYGGVYWPDVIIEDDRTKRRIEVPASVAALGALAFNDRVSYPWFAPAGFNRAALDFVKNVKIRLGVPDRDRLYEARINPIATFPRHNFVIYGQKTLQVARTSLDRVNVRRLLLEIKRIVVDEAKNISFEMNDIETRNNFTARAVFRLGMIQTRSGIESFSVVCNESNNTSEDINQNKMNGRVVVVPTRTIEFVVTNFVITTSGIEFL